MSHESQKAEHADRTAGGPGSSHQNADKPETHHHKERDRPTGSGGSTNTTRSQVSGGGGERDRHHTRDPDHNATTRDAEVDQA